MEKWYGKVLLLLAWAALILWYIVLLTSCGPEPRGGECLDNGEICFFHEECCSGRCVQYVDLESPEPINLPICVPQEHKGEETWD